jgi:hypothetical protein
MEPELTRITGRGGTEKVARSLAPGMGEPGVATGDDVA